MKNDTRREMSMALGALLCVVLLIALFLGTGATGQTPGGVRVFGTNTTMGWFQQFNFSNVNMRVSGGVLYITPLGSGGAGGGTGSFSFATTQFDVVNSTNVTLKDGAVFTNGLGYGFRVTYRTGTTNPIFRANNSNGVAVLFINTNGLVGIGKTNPVVALDVAGAGAFSGALGVNGTLSANGDVVVSGTTAGEASTWSSLGVGGLSVDSSGGLAGTTATLSGNISALEALIGTNMWLGLQKVRAYASSNEFGLQWTNGSTFLRYRLDLGRVELGALTYTFGTDRLTNASMTFTEHVLPRSGSGLFDLGSYDNWWRTNYVAYLQATQITTVGAEGMISLLGTNGVGYSFKAANSNSVEVTNVVGLLHKAAASVVVLDANHGNQFSITSRVAAATSIVITNLAEGQDVEFTILGEASGGSSRVITVIPQSGHLVADLDTFGTALATSFSLTLTNGNAAEISTRSRKLNGTNIASVVSRQFAF